MPFSKRTEARAPLSYRYRTFFPGLLALGFAASGCNQLFDIERGTYVEPGDGGGHPCEGSISVKIASDFSGTATDIAIPYHFGLYDYLRKLNDTGGIRGCPIEIEVADNHYDPQTTATVIDAWRSGDSKWSKVVTVFVFGTGPTMRVGPQLMAEHKVIIPGSYAGSLASPVPVSKDISYPVVNDTFQQIRFSERKTSAGWPYVFFPLTDYGTAIRLGVQSAWRLTPGKIAMAHDTADACSYCAEPLAAGKSYVESLPGMSLGRDLIFPQTSSQADAPKINDAVQKYFAEEITHVIADPSYVPVSWIWSGNSVFGSSTLGAAVAVAQKTIAADTRIPPAVASKWTLRVIANNWGIGETTSGTCGAGCDDIFYGLFPVPRYGDLKNASVMATLVALHDAYTAKDFAPNPPMPARRSGDHRDVRYVQGFAAGVLWEKGMLAAIDAGHSNPTGEDLKQAFETFRQVDLGITAGPVTFTATDHRPQSEESVYKLDSNGNLAWVDNYQVELVQDWLGY